MLAVRGRRRRAVRRHVSAHRAGAVGGSARPGVDHGRGELDHGLLGPRRVPASGASRGHRHALRDLLAGDQRRRDPRRDRVLQLEHARAGRRAARRDGKPRQPDRPDAGAATGGVACPRGRRAPPGDRGRGSRLHHHDRRGRPRARVQPGRREHVRLQRVRGRRARHGRADRSARAARTTPRGLRALRSRGDWRAARPPHRDHRHATGRQRVPGGADDHAHRGPRSAALHRLRARHHRAPPGGGRAAGLARPHRGSRRRGAPTDRTQPP